MRIRRGYVCFLLSLLFIANVSNATVVEVLGTGECAGCEEHDLKTSQAFTGLKVTIDCKPQNGAFKTRGSGELDGEGKFKVSLPEDIVEDGKLKEKCYAQLHNAEALPCPAHDGLEAVEIVQKSSNAEKQSFGLKGKLKFSPVTCASAFFLPHYYYPPLPKLKHPKLPKFPLPPPKGFGHHIPKIPKVFPPFHKPIFKKPLPPPVPVYKKPLPPPVYKKPLPPPVPVYKKPEPPPTPVYKKPHPPPAPVYKKPCPPPYKKPHPPPVPVYKKPNPPPVPVYKKPLPPPVPIYKKPLPPPSPIYVKPHPPFLPKIPPFPKKAPCPPFPKPKLPPFPKLPPKIFHHPKFGHHPPLPPFAPYAP